MPTFPTAHFENDNGDIASFHAPTYIDGISNQVDTSSGKNLAKFGLELTSKYVHRVLISAHVANPNDVDNSVIPYGIRSLKKNVEIAKK